MQQTNADKLQSVIGDDLFPQVAHISDVKQVLEEMRRNAQNMREVQIKGLLLLKSMGENKYLYPDGNPYKKIIDYISTNAKEMVADPWYFIDTIEALIPKPPKPIVLADVKGKGR